MPGHRHRYMYYATGLPGWMRFGFSPGWQGVSPTGMGPGATFLTTGRWPTPQAQSAWQAMQQGGGPYPGAMQPGYPPPGGGGMPYQPTYPGGAGPAPGMQPTKEQEVQFLRTQAQQLQDHLEKIKERLAQLEE